MSLGTSISRDFMWRILMLPSIPLAVNTSQANSYIVLDSSQAYTSAAPAFLAHILNRENQKIRTIIPSTDPILPIAKRIKCVCTLHNFKNEKFPNSHGKYLTQGSQCQYLCQVQCCSRSEQPSGWLAGTSGSSHGRWALRNASAQPASWPHGRSSPWLLDSLVSASRLYGNDLQLHL